MKADGGNLLVMRLLYDRGIQSFGSLGFNARQIGQLKEYVYRRKGAFFISGPTGGGKTTTLYAACDSIIKESGQSIRLITVEDPIESKVPGARHTELQYELSAGQDANKQAWVGAIRNCVRLDPDVMMVGEIRDLESAIGAIHFAMTGHGLLATVHTETATQILDRLREMGVDKSLLADAVIMRCLANQSLAPKNCPRCRQPYMKVRARVPEAVRQRIEKYCVDPRNVFLQGRDRACPECGGRGVKGRIAIAEIITTTQELLDMWAEHGGARMRRLWIEQGGEPKSRALVDAVCSGILDPIVGEKEVGCLMSDDRL
jgi:type II secretory ATPase GspE/PulE/Tfp pilus assembly ATPase PilB-like protein